METFFGAAFLVVIVLQLVLIYVYIRRSVEPHRDVLLEQGKIKTNSLLHRAIQQANKILVTAELKGIHLISKQKMTGSELTKEFQTHLASVEKALSDQLIRNTEHAESTYEEFIKGAENAIKEHVKANEKMLSDKSNAMVEKTSEMLGVFTKEVEEKVKADIEKKKIEAPGENPAGHSQIGRSHRKQVGVGGELQADLQKEQPGAGHENPAEEVDEKSRDEAPRCGNDRQGEHPGADRCSGDQKGAA